MKLLVVCVGSTNLKTCLVMATTVAQATSKEDFFQPISRVAAHHTMNNYAAHTLRRIELRSMLSLQGRFGYCITLAFMRRRSRWGRVLLRHCDQSWAWVGEITPKTGKDISSFVLKLVSELYNHEFSCHLGLKFVQ
jgi:hypothetical protein